MDIKQKSHQSSNLIDTKLNYNNNDHPSSILNTIYKSKLKRKEIVTILRHYNFKKLSENKQKLLLKLEKLKFYLFHERQIIIIQKCVKKFVLSLRLILHGDMYNLPVAKSVNHEDFCTLEHFNDIDKANIISYTNSHGSKFLFKIDSLLRLYHSSQVNRTPRNPYTREKLPQQLFDSMFEIIYRKKHKPQKRNHSYTHSKYWQNRKIMKMIETKCAKMNYTIKYEWVMNTPIRKIHKLYGILYDIWNTSGNITMQTKEELVDFPNRLFIYGKYSFWYVLNIDKVRKEILNIMSKLVVNQKTSETQVLGIIIILYGMIKVNEECRSLYSWLDI